MSTSPDRFRLRNHFTVLVYPFLHGVDAANRSRRLDGLASGWQPWWSRLDQAQAAATFDGTSFFLPNIRDVLYPEAVALEHPAGTPASWHAHLSRGEADDGWRSWKRSLASDVILHLTCRRDVLDPLRALCLASNTSATPAPIKARLDWIDAVLFPSGVGFLLLKVRLADDAATLNRLIDLNYYARFVHPPRTNWALPTLHWSAEAPPWTMRDLIDFLLQGMVDQAEQPPVWSRAAFQERVEQAGAERYTESDPGQVYGERCQVVSYACIEMAEARRQDRAAGVFATAEDRLLYEYASCIPLGDSVRKPTWKPSREEVESLTHRQRFDFWQGWRGIALQESVVFLATKDLPFTTGALAHNVESDYLPLYLYVLHQRYQLFLFSDDLRNQDAYADRNLREVRALIERFFRFRKHFRSSKVTRKPEGHTLYRAFQYGLDVPALHARVHGEIKMLDAFCKERHAQRTNRLVDLITFVSVALGFATSIFGMTVLSSSSWLWLLPAWGGAVALLVWWWRTRT